MSNNKLNFVQTDEIIKRIGNDSIDANHEYFIANAIDNSEYLANLRMNIKSISASAAEMVSHEFSQIFKTDLRNRAEEYFVTLWIKLAQEEEGDDFNLKKELKKAKKIFSEGFDVEKLNSIEERLL